ncbi:MAG TPA: hypothetical protein VHC90_21225, partial [Bryobacteraceae bacterium]|nr:hypothetical protein [Bryobacteraceae bacterium]
ALMLLAASLAAQPKPQPKPNVATLVKRALGEGIVPYAAVRPIFADFNGDGQNDLAVVVDFNKHLETWLRRGIVIHNLDSPSLAPMRPDNEQHFCFGLLILDHMLPEKKTIFYGCFTGWRLAKSSTAAIDLDMESGDTLRLFNDGARFRTRVVRKN